MDQLKVYTAEGYLNRASRIVGQLITKGCLYRSQLAAPGFSPGAGPPTTSFLDYIGISPAERYHWNYVGVESCVNGLGKDLVYAEEGHRRGIAHGDTILYSNSL